MEDESLYHCCEVVGIEIGKKTLAISLRTIVSNKHVVLLGLKQLMGPARFPDRTMIRRFVV